MGLPDLVKACNLFVYLNVQFRSFQFEEVQSTFVTNIHQSLLIVYEFVTYALFYTFYYGGIYYVGESCMPPTYCLLTALPNRHVAEFCTHSGAPKYAPFMSSRSDEGDTTVSGRDLYGIALLCQYHLGLVQVSSNSLCERCRYRRPLNRWPFLLTPWSVCSSVISFLLLGNIAGLSTFPMKASTNKTIKRPTANHLQYPPRECSHHGKLQKIHMLSH